MSTHDLTTRTFLTLLPRHDLAIKVVHTLNAMTLAPKTCHSNRLAFRNLGSLKDLKYMLDNGHRSLHHILTFIYNLEPSQGNHHILHK